MSDADANTSPAAEEPTESGSSPSMPSVDEAKQVLTSMHQQDLGIVIAGAVALVASFLPFFNISVSVFGVKDKTSFNAWHDILGGGFFGWFGVIAAVAGALALVLPLFKVSLPVPRRLAALGLFGLSTLLLLIAFFVTPVDCNDGLFDACDMVDGGHSLGYYLALLAAIAGTVLAAMRRGED